MKVWYGYGSEHSMNLVMIGHFQEVGDATKAKEMIEQLTEQVNADVQTKHLKPGQLNDRYSDGMLKLLSALDLRTIGTVELEQFAYDYTVEVDNNHLVMKTDEADVSAFLKVLIENGARIEVYSAHRYPNSDL